LNAEYFNDSKSHVADVVNLSRHPKISRFNISASGIGLTWIHSYFDLDALWVGSLAIVGLWSFICENQTTEPFISS